MKPERIKSATFNNRKKALTVNYASGKSVDIHYRQVGITKNLANAWVDKETRGLSLRLIYEDQSEDYMPFDQPLALAKDPEYLLQDHIERLVAHIKEAIREKKISKRYLAEQLHTSDNQIQRLLNPAILNKNLEQLYKIAAVLGLEFEWSVKKAI
jgi:hypothetical protein